MADHEIKRGTVFNTTSLTGAKALTAPNAEGWFAARACEIGMDYVVVHISEVNLSINTTP